MYSFVQIACSAIGLLGFGMAISPDSHADPSPPTSPICINRVGANRVHRPAEFNRLDSSLGTLTGVLRYLHRHSNITGMHYEHRRR